jgi:hypothetical protein
MRIFDFGLNCFLVSTHILKGGSEFNPDDPFATFTDDLTIKTLDGLNEVNTSSLGVEPFYVYNEAHKVNVTWKSDGVLNMFEECQHPHKFKFDYDIYLGDDEPMTMLQD